MQRLGFGPRLEVPAPPGWGKNVMNRFRIDKVGDVDQSGSTESVHEKTIVGTSEGLL